MRINGAVYIPSYSYNAFMMWHDYDGEAIAREFGYARRIGIGALRLWLSYESWRQGREGYKAKLDHLLEAASEAHLKIMPSLFECCTGNGDDYDYETPESLPSVAINSPGTRIQTDSSLWDGPAAFVSWFMENYGSDDRLLAVEVANEPQFGRNGDMPFVMAMFRQAASLRGSVPLTVGSISLEHNIPFLGLGLDILQYHDNFPLSAEYFERELKQGIELGELLNKPVWITEWQRIRPTGPGWEQAAIPEEDKQPYLASLAPLLEKHGVTSFLWSLMLRPAYLNAQRINRTFNGIFHRDGSVWSLEDAESVAGRKGLLLRENRTSPYETYAEMD